MKNALRALGLLSVVVGASLCSSPLHAQNDPLAALLSRSGEVTIRRTRDDRVLATIKPGLFEQTWQMRNVSPSGKISATTAGATVSVERQAELENNGRRLRLRYTLTPDKPVAVNSAHVSVSVPATGYVGKTATIGPASATVPAAAGATALVSGTGTLKLDPIAVTSDRPILLQDGRVFGGGDLEIRVGTQGERTLTGGAAETIAVTVDLPGPVTLEREEPITLTAGADWVPLPLQLDIAPGSALDWSFLADAPAGKYGRVVARPDGHFGFEKKNTPARFYGVNLCFSANYLDHALADRLADRLQRTGYNTVRVHHYESELIDTSAPDSLTLRPDSLDKLDYLIAALKKRGLYIKTDLFVSRPVKASELDTEPGMDEFKAAVLVSDKAMDNWKAFARKLLTHVNPYTKTAYKDEPALAFLSVVNEPNATNYLGRLTGRLRARYETEWAAWRASKNLPAATLPKTIDASTPLGRETGSFLAFLHARAFAKMKAFLRTEIGAPALLTDNNGWSETPAFMAARTQLDWVDNHFYWDHPQFLEKEWQLPTQGGSGGRGAIEANGAGPSDVAMTRLIGKPFTVSEFNYSAPNPYRAEGGLIMGAASALQDWDAVWRFAYSHSREAVASPQPMSFFDMATDPAGMASERAAIALFLRRDARPAAALQTRNWTKSDLESGKAVPAQNFADQTLTTRVGTRVVDQATPTAWPPDVAFPSQIAVDAANGLLRIDTPRTVGGVAPAGQTITAGALSATIAGTRAALWASSLDDQPVATSKRLLLVHLTDVQMTGMRYAAPDRRVLQSWGTLPHLARAGAATVTLTRPDAARLQAWRLDTSGKRIAPLPIRVVNNKAVLDLTTKAPSGTATIYYEITRP